MSNEAPISKKYFSDPSDRPTEGTRWHSRPDCSGLYCTEIADVDLQRLGVDPGPNGKCRTCDRRDRNLPEAVKGLIQRMRQGRGVRGSRQTTIEQAKELGVIRWDETSSTYQIVDSGGST